MSNFPFVSSTSSTTAFDNGPASTFLCLRRKAYFLLLVFAACTAVHGFVPSNPTMITGRTSVDSGSLLYFSAPVEQQDQQSQTNEEWKDPDAPAGIDGAEFFGGNKQKEEFFDPIAEQQAAEEVQASQQAMTYGRFFASSDQPSAAFENVWTARLGQSLQQKLNSIIYTPANQSARTSVLQIEWAANLKWETPFVSSKENASPVVELQAAKEFYRQIDIAVVGGRQLSDSTVEFSWELAVVWPTFWAPRVHLSGTSTLTLKEALGPSTNNAAITQQVDCVFSSSNNNLLPLLASQIKPRFWDWYHIGMSPTTELLPRETVKNGSYKVYRLPSRLVLSPTMVETGTRNTRNAQVIPNHAFTCIIKTMGPQKQDYVPASPVQVQIGRRKIQSEDSVMEDVQLELSWGIPLSVQFQAMNEELPLPGDNPEDDARSSPRCCYSLQPRRQVATIAYGGNVQDPEVTDVRKRLYQQVLKDGWKPKLDENGRPMFFFWQNDVKACYTDEGLGMAIYEWRPALAKSNEVGIELQIN